MTYAIAMIKGKPKAREKTQNLFMLLSKDTNFANKTSVEIKEVFLSFGSPDFVLILKGPNVELLKQAIITIREESAKIGDEIQTSTLICTTQEEISRKCAALAHDSVT